jgi:uncharacterized protein
MAYNYVCMIQRTCKLSDSNSFFLFGARATGKSTLIKQWAKNKNVLAIDLLDPHTESRYVNQPEILRADWQAAKPDWVVVDEIQKNIKLLDVIQSGIVDDKMKFALTGSSARKLKRGSANLLGGRAFEFRLHPFNYRELGNRVPLQDLLQWGSLPEVIELVPADKVRKLFAYVSTYLKEEILYEQVLRKFEPFRKFLEIAAQMNGKILNYAKIARALSLKPLGFGRAG